MKYSSDNVPHGYYKYFRNEDDGRLVRVMEQDNKKVVSFINNSYPILLKDVPKDVIFSKSTPHPEFGLSTEEIEGREYELALFFAEELTSLNVDREGKKLCVSREIGNKIFSFVLNIELSSVEEKDEQ